MAYFLCKEDVDIEGLLKKGGVKKVDEYNARNLPLFSDNQPSVPSDAISDEKASKTIDGFKKLLKDCYAFLDTDVSLDKKTFYFYRALEGTKSDLMKDVYSGPFYFAVIEFHEERLEDRIVVLVEGGINPVQTDS